MTAWLRPYRKGPAADDRDIETIVQIVNPSLLNELRERQNQESPS